MPEKTWDIRLCAGVSDDIKELLDKATLKIGADEATWKLEGVDVTGSATPKGGKLCGELRFKDESYYYEIVFLTPPPTISAKPRAYGIFGRIDPDKRSGGDLGDPGIWKAEESGNDPLG